MARDPGSVQSYCRLDLCDDTALVFQAYDRQMMGETFSLAIAVEWLRGVLARNPASADRWADLGDALAQAGSLAQAGTCYRNALWLAPHTARLLVNAGSFYLQFGDRREGLQCLSRALRLTSRFDAGIFSTFDALGASVGDVLASGLPEDRRAAEAYLRSLMSEPSPEDARQVWQWMLAYHLGDATIAAEYSSFLVRQKLYRDAAKAWASGNDGAETGYLTTQFIYNGGFEREPAGTPFDWKLSGSDHVEVVRDAQPYSGSLSLRLRFDGAENLDYHEAGQQTVLAPGKYLFQAFVRSENLTTDQGVGFRISDAEVSSRFTADTERVTGTTPWHPVSVTFVVPAATELVDIRVIRRPSLKFDNQISGLLWIDQISLTPIR